MMVILLLLTTHRGAAVHGAISLMEGNGTATTDIICTGECLVADQYAELAFEPGLPLEKIAIQMLVTTAFALGPGN